VLNFNKIIIIAGLFVISFSAFSQKQIITFSPQGLVNKIRVKYESPINKNLSIGSYLNLYYMYFKGVRIDPFVRFYLAGKAPKGIYIQGKLVAGYFNSNIEYEYEKITQTDTSTVTIKERKSFLSFGGGMGLGYQFIIGKPGFPLDLYLGFQNTRFLAPQTIIKDNITYETSYDSDWYITGPGSFLNMNFGIGFSF
jgi:hypothetical protein